MSRSARRKGGGTPRSARGAAARRTPVTPPPPIERGLPDDPPVTVAPPRSPAAEREQPAVPERFFAAAALAILLVALLIRVWALSLNPFHHDEGINGWFVTNLIREGAWRYDPANYHGPTLFYFAVVAETLFGLTSEAMRLVAVFFGMATIALVLALRPFIGSLATLIGAALLCVSPGASYVSRYFIHESLVVFFTLAIVVSALYFWQRREQRYLVAGAAAAALLFATKETGIVNVAVLAIAAGMAVAWVQLRGPGGRLAAGGTARAGRRSPAANRRGGRNPMPEPAGRWAGVRDRFTYDGVVAATAVFVALYVLFFTSFLSNPKGLVDSLATFTIWTQTGTETQVQPFQQYLVWMLRADPAILIVGTIGGLVVAWRAHSVVAVFFGLWALGITLAFSLVSYKTPWIALNMLVPLAVLGGIGVSEALRLLHSRELRSAVAVGLAGLLAFSSFQAYDLNFVHYDDETYPYSYVHTTREALALVDETTRIAHAAGTDEQTGIVIVVDRGEYWPLPWYYRDWPRAGFFGSIVATEEAMIIARIDQEQDPALQEIVNGRYQRHAVYKLRPAVDLVLYVRNDLADL